jgi:crotonobetainyl-CoA:carnitine CoA-transferase CaiB-like acyl-CoA transferase
LLGLDGMATAPEYLTNADRIANRDEMTRLLTEATLQRSKAELLAACEAKAFRPVRSTTWPRFSPIRR